MINQLSAVYQLICALLVTLCFDKVFRNFAWSSGTFSNILNSTNEAFSINKKHLRTALNVILKEKYNEYFEQAKYHSFIYLGAFAVLLYISCCQLDYKNPVLIYGLATWIIGYCTLITVLFVLLRGFLFDRFYKFLIEFSLLFSIVLLHYYCYKNNCYIFDYVIFDFTSKTHYRYITLFSALLGILPFMYFFLHCKMFDKVYRWFLISSFRTNNIYTDFKDSIEVKKNLIIKSDSNDRDDGSLNINRVYETLKRRNLVGIISITSSLWLMLGINLLVLFLKWVSDFAVGCIGRLVLFGRRIKRLIYRKHAKRNS